MAGIEYWFEEQLLFEMMGEPIYPRDIEEVSLTLTCSNNSCGSGVL